MDFVQTGWALLPPVIAILIALKTKEVYLSLFFPQSQRHLWTLILLVFLQKRFSVNGQEQWPQLVQQF